MRSQKKKPFSESRKNSKFKVTNWPEYNNILRNRGRIDFMIAEDLSDGWYEDHDDNKKRGGQIKYSDKAISTIATIPRMVWNMLPRNLCGSGRRAWQPGTPKPKGGQQT